MATAKLNKEKLKKMISQQDEAPLTLGKRQKTDSSSKKVVDEKSLPPPPVQKPSLPDPAPASLVEVIEISTAPSSSKPMERVPTLPKDASLAMRRAKTVVTKDDVGEYDKVTTDVVKMAAVHSLIKVGCFAFSFLNCFFVLFLGIIIVFLGIGFDRGYGAHQSLLIVGGGFAEAESPNVRGCPG